MKKKQKISIIVQAGIALLLIVFGLIADILGYARFTETITAAYQETVFSIAREAGSMVRAEDIPQFLKTMGSSPEYRKAHQQLYQLTNTMEAEFIFVVRIEDGDFDHGIFAIETCNRNSPFDEFPVGYRLDLSHGEYVAYQNAYRQMYEEGVEEAVVVQNRGKIETGYHISALVALRDGEGRIQGVLAVQKQMKELYDARREYLRSITSATCMLIFVSALGCFLFLRRRILDPLDVIGEEANRFAAENTLPERSLKERVPDDEFGTLAEHVDEMERRTLAYFAELARVTEEKQRVDAELDLARAIQSSALPGEFPRSDQFELYATMDPAREVGGDFYDFFLVDDRHLAVVIADVSGKGIPASLFMMVAKNLIKNQAKMGIAPRAVFTTVNNQLCEGNETGLFVTAWIGVLDLVTGTVTCCNAGHNPPVLQKADGELSFLKGRSGFVLAGMEGIVYRQEEFAMAPGDRLFLYTDGVTEAADSSLEQYGEERLAAFLDAHREENGRELLTGLRRDIDRFAGEAEQFDDMTMLALRFRGGLR